MMAPTPLIPKKKKRPRQTREEKEAAARKRAERQAKKISNTATFPYLAKDNKADCINEKERIHQKCDVEKKHESKSKSGGINILDGVAKTEYRYKRNKNNGWMDDHCAGLWVKPSEVMKFVEKLKTELQTDIVEVLKDAGGTIVKEAKDAAIKKGEQIVISEGAAATTLVFPAVGEIIVGGVTLFNMISSVYTAGTIAVEAGKAAKDAYDTIKALNAELGELTKWASASKLDDVVAMAQKTIALANPCIRARKCMLVPFKDAGSKAGKGCCPGQTGHHVLPDAMFRDVEGSKLARDEFKKIPGNEDKTINRDKLPTRACWGKYVENAPTMCLEGTKNHDASGSHGKAHAKTEDYTKDHRILPDMSYTDASTELSKRMAKSFGCDYRCIKAQLDHHYKEKALSKGCDLSTAQVTPHSGRSGGGPIIETGDHE
jgi:hypothetical protein